MNPKKVYAVYIDGNHVTCHETEAEAQRHMVELHTEGFRMAEVEHDDFEPKCDCGNKNLSEHFVNGGAK